VPLVRARRRGEPHPPKTPGRERISGLEARRAAGPGLRPPRERGGLDGAVWEALDLVVWGRGDVYFCLAPVRENPPNMADGTIA
jgi:hypothetical protein